MPYIEIPDELWNEIIAQQARLDIPTQADPNDIPRIYLSTPEGVRKLQ
jgi:hypothetical protein